jgi:hypothetical protein
MVRTAAVHERPAGMIDGGGTVNQDGSAVRVGGDLQPAR